MFPLEFDYEILATLPVPNNEDITRVGQILEAIMTRRVIPYFKKKRGTDSIVLAKAMKKFSIARLEDEVGQVRMISLLTRNDDAWSLMVHECIFDHLAFVIPSGPDSGWGTALQKKHFTLAAQFLGVPAGLPRALLKQTKRAATGGSTEYC